jgi:hypothetical protein
MLHTPDNGSKRLHFGKGANGKINAWVVDFEENGTINANTVKANMFCIGNTCINKDHLKNVNRK